MRILIGLVFVVGCGSSASQGPDATVVGVPATCALDLDFCGTPAAGGRNVCGQLLDVATDAPLRAAVPTGAACDPASPTADGPCALRVTVADAIAVVSAPTAETSLGHVVVDDCGRFALRDGSGSGSELVGVLVRDATGDTRVPTLAMTASARDTTVLVPAYAVPTAIDAAWSASAVPGGPTLGARGATLVLYRRGAEPVAGVTPLRNGEATPAASTFFFADADPTGRTQPIAATAGATTGANGAALLVDDPLLIHGGSGGLPAACAFREQLLVSVPGLYVVRPIEAVMAAAPATACP